tara:strand:+ start:131 stop:331 length:201 start_codon:yes stop_codon:yes gene_type:complete
MKPIEFKRKLYKRGSSFETTIPKPLLFALDTDEKHHVVFAFDEKENRWFIKFEEIKKKTVEDKVDD